MLIIIQKNAFVNSVQPAVLRKNKNCTKEEAAEFRLPLLVPDALVCQTNCFFQTIVHFQNALSGGKQGTVYQ